MERDEAHSDPPPRGGSIVGNEQAADLVSRLRTLVIGPPWWAQQQPAKRAERWRLRASPEGTGDDEAVASSAARASSGPRPPHWSQPDESLVALQRLTGVMSLSDWDDAYAMNDAMALLTRLLRKPATHNEAMACCPALARLFEVCEPSGDSLLWACRRLRMTCGAGTERAAHLELSLLGVLGSACRTSAGRRRLLAVIDFGVLASLCRQEVSGDHALSILQKCCQESSYPVGVIDLQTLAATEPEGAFATVFASITLVPGLGTVPTLRAAYALQRLWSAPGSRAADVLAAAPDKLQERASLSVREASREAMREAVREARAEGRALLSSGPGSATRELSERERLSSAARRWLGALEAKQRKAQEREWARLQREGSGSDN